MIHKGSARDDAVFLNSNGGSPSGPLDLLGLSFLEAAITFSGVKLITSSFHLYHIKRVNDDALSCTVAADLLNYVNLVKFHVTL